MTLGFVNNIQNEDWKTSPERIAVLRCSSAAVLQSEGEKTLRLKVRMPNNSTRKRRTDTDTTINDEVQSERR